MSILNRGWIYDSITRNQDSGSVSYRWTHGANDTYMGSGIMYFSIPYFLKARVCVCLGSGGGYVPRLMVDCVHELNETQMYGEDLEILVSRNKKTAFVENLFYDYMDGYYSINNGYLKVTREHDLFTYADKKWRWNTARELKEGMKLLNFLGEIVNIDSVEWIDGEVEVINFDVEPLDIYYAGGVLVHNKGASSEP